MAEYIESSPMTYYISIVSGSLLVLSETLPYISKIKGNSILQVLLELLNKKQQEIKEDKNKFDTILEKLEEMKKLIETALGKIN